MLKAFPSCISGCFRKASPGCLSRFPFRFATAASMPSVPLRASRRNLQLDAVLAKLITDVQQEFVTEEGYSIDVRMLWEGEYVGVEVDGPSHFLTGCGGRSPTGATTLKRRQLRALGWQVVVVPYFEWDKLTSAAARYQYLSSKLQSQSYRIMPGKQLPHQHLQSDV